jgi:nucleoid DNA-binding protein
MNKQRLSKKKFFEKLSEESGVYDSDTVERLYYSLERLITRELLEKGSISLPDLGEFYLRLRAPKKFSRYGVMLSIPAMKTMQFKPDYKKKAYFKML